MTNTKNGVRKSSCSACPSSFELIPPADQDYSVPGEKPQSEDYIQRIYECGEGHRNTIYWEKEEDIVISSGPSESELEYQRRYGNRYGRYQRGELDSL